MAIAETVSELAVKLLHPDARAPERSREGDAGYDLRSLEAFVLGPGERRLVATGVAIALPPGLAGLAARHGVTTLNAPGLVDPGYRGEVKVILHNAGREPYEAQVGDRVAQLLLVPFWAPALRVVDDLPAAVDDRGADGFGSSGR
jgi:dUTP pyrophosphatase